MRDVNEKELEMRKRERVTEREKDIVKVLSAVQLHELKIHHWLQSFWKWLK